ncbi:MAG: response regulator [Lachnospiraceae bacterium]|nr:response regulator [Lachnospiraceae bacterium]
MILDYLENIVQLSAILVAVLLSLFRYIESKNKSWLYAVSFFFGSLLSSYFWTAYLVIMGDTPNVSDVFAYFGWNLAFFSLVPLLIHMKNGEGLRYFHVIMLIPIPLNIWQFTIYMQFGGILNSAYQVAICTLIAMLCLQSVMWYVKKKKDGAKKPYVAYAILVYVISEFGMWTSSSFDGLVADLYYPFSFLASATYLLLVWAMVKSLEEDESVEVHIGLKIQGVLKIAYVIVVILGSVGGILLGVWIRNKIAAGVNSESETDIFSIIPLILFLTSILMVVAAAVVIFVVTIEQKILENNKLREERQIAERSNVAKSEFLAQMSHEIRTPMNAVLGMNEVVLRESMKAVDSLPEDPEKLKTLFSDIKGYAGNIDSAGHSLLSIINDILDISKIEAGKLEIREEEYTLSSILNDISNMVGLRAEAKGLDFIIEVEEKLPDRLYGDELRIRQVITNILNNAVKYTREGSVTLYVGENGPQSYEAGKMMELVVAVRDTGIGIKEEDTGRLFNKYERMDLSKNKRIEGTGLGLSITQELLQLMNGSIDVKSDYGKGSEFVIRIPQKIISIEPIGDFRVKSAKDMEGKMNLEEELKAPEARILVVDDTKVNLIVVKSLLKDTELMVDTCDSGEKSLEMIKETSYDLVLMDQRMPGMDGVEALHHIREMEEGKDIPVICLTADAIQGAKKHYMEEGFNDYLTKPVDGKLLKQMIREYLPEEKVIGGSKTMEGIKNYEGKDIFAILEEAGVNTKEGLSYINEDKELYKSILLDYRESTAQSIDKIRGCMRDKNMKDYGIYAHSIKSTSKTIGADELSEIAKGLEAAADEEDWQAILKASPALISKADALIKLIGEIEDQL